MPSSPCLCQVGRVLAPDLGRKRDDQAQLGELIRFGQEIAGLGAGEAALRAESELVERQMALRLLESALEFVLRFEIRALGGDEPEHDSLALGDQAQGREIAGAWAVIFEEIAVG